MASNENAVFLSPYGTCIRKEAVGSGVIKPAMLLDRSGSDVVAAALTEGDYLQILIADNGPTVEAGSFESSYADGDVVNFKSPMRGELVRLYVGASQTISVGDELASKGSGEAGAPAVAGVGVIAYAQTALTTGVGESGYVVAEVL